MRADIYARDSDLDRYKEEKVRVLEDFRIFLTEDDKQYLSELTTENAVDMFARRMINTKTRAIGKGKTLRMVSEEEYAALSQERK